jgi:RNA polymerase sigma factor (sigma-70 family)
MTSALESTASLIQRAKKGDGQAREQLAARYLPLLQRWAHGRLPAKARRLQETNDLVQVTLMRALDRLDFFESTREGAFLAYLRRALMNQLRNELKRSMRDPQAITAADIADSATPLLALYVDIEVIEAYESGLATLPEATQEAIILSLEFGMSHRQVAEAIGSASANAARMTISRGLARLAKVMSEGAKPSMS